jgi:hypothetical protein
MRLFLFFWLILLIGCRSRDSAILLPQGPIPDDILITLRRSVCYGPCPDYTVTIAADGTVTFEGRQFVKTKGIAKGSLSREGMRQLIAEFERANYFSLNDKYQSAEDGCPEQWTDAPTAVTSIRINGKSKSVLHYHGCQDGQVVYPKALTALENKIDEIVGTNRWVK